MTRMYNPPHPGEVLRDGVFTGTGITVTAFAKRIGVTRVTLSNVLNGKNGISADMAVRLAAALGGKMGRTVADLRFEAGPDDVTAIIAEFDANPDIDCITDLKLSYNPVTKRVGVQMMVEKWGVVPATPARGGS